MSGVSKDEDSGNLTLNSGESLEINTTNGNITKKMNGTVEKSCKPCPISSNVTNMTFSGQITFRSGSSVKVVGKNALRMKSLDKDILVETDINMTCDDELFNSTCLGGSTQSLIERKIEDSTTSAKYPLYLGLGKGGPVLKANSALYTEICLPGSSHGGGGSCDIGVLEAGPSYGTSSTSPLLGGSAGSCARVNVTRPGRVAGGGAIELIAEKGDITIGASIIASAQQDSVEAGKLCSGGSGGHIRLKAGKVEIKDGGKLIVDGGDALVGENFNTRGRAGAGAGGVIHIIASEVYLAVNSSSLKHGQNGSCDRKSEDGYFLFKQNETSEAVVNGTFSQFPPQDPFVRPPAASTTAATTASSLSTNSTDTLPTKTTPDFPTEERAQSLLNQIHNIKISLLAGNKVKATAVSDVLTEHESLTASSTLKEATLDLCLAVFEEYKIIVSQLAEHDLVEKIIRGGLTVATNCLSEKNHEIWRKTRELPNLIENVEQVLVAAVQRNVSSMANLTRNTKKVAVQVRQSSLREWTDLTLPDYSEINGTAWSGVSDSISIPKELLQSEGNYTYVIVLYKDVESGLPIEHSSVRGVEKVSSLVMSCSLIFGKSIVGKLSHPVILTFYSSKTEGRERSCSYWNSKESAWASDGVTLQKPESTSGRTVCKTHHLTSFAVLMQHKEIPIPEKDKLALSIITYIGCGISTLALVITIIIFLSIESLSTDRHKIHANLALALLLAQILFLSGITETSSKVLCKMIAVFLHYFFLTAFTWMLVEGVHLYLKVVQVFRTENFRMAYYYVFGWCFPAIPVGVTAAMKLESYGNENVCWLSMKDGTVWAFIGPVVAIIAINCLILFMVVKTVVSSVSAVKSANHSNDQVKAGVKGLLVLMPILGVSWLLGLFYVDRNTLFFQYAFAICNAFQGLLIFLLHCVFNSEVRQAFRRQQEKRALSKESGYSQYNASFSFSETGSANTSKKERSSNGFEKLRARLSLRLLSGSKVVQVQPLTETRNSDEISLQVKRTYEKNFSKCLPAADHQSGVTSLNCPMEDKEGVPPKQTSLVSQHSQQAAVRRKQRP